MKSSKIFIYTDGSCKGNPGPGGWAALFIKEKETKPFIVLKGQDVSTTNNRMEMMAVLQALSFIHQKNLQNNSFTLFSDSNLIVQTLLQGWKRKANLDLWIQIDELRKGLTIRYVWVKGHASNKWNIECDKIAQKEAQLASKLGPQKNPAPKTDAQKIVNQQEPKKSERAHPDQQTLF